MENKAIFPVSFLSPGSNSPFPHLLPQTCSLPAQSSKHTHPLRFSWMICICAGLKSQKATACSAFRFKWGFFKMRLQLKKTRLICLLQNRYQQTSFGYSQGGQESSLIISGLNDGTVHSASPCFLATSAQISTSVRIFCDPFSTDRVPAD